MQHEEGAQEKIEAYSNVQKKALVDWANSAKQNKLKQTVLPKIIIMAMNGVSDIFDNLGWHVVWRSSGASPWLRVAKTMLYPIQQPSPNVTPP